MAAQNGYKMPDDSILIQGRWRVGVDFLSASFSINFS